MYQSIQLTNTTQSARNFAHRSPWRPDLLLIPIALACFALSQTGRAVTPPPDGGYPSQNTAEGEDALFHLGRGVRNTAVGFQALFNDRDGWDNTAIGQSALHENTSGFYNIAIGSQALYFNTTGRRNTANGLNALYANTTGNNNTACGYQALAGNTTGRNNIGLGYFAGSSGRGNNNIGIGAVSVVDESNTIRIGDSHQTATFISGISGATVAGGVGVIIDSNGHLGTVTSLARFKDEIKPMDKASEAIFDLKPVTFRYKRQLDPRGLPQFGLVAEQVEKVSPDLVARDEQGKVYTVRYDAVNAMLLNEFLKEHCKVEEQARTNQEQQVTIAELRASIAQQSKEITALTECFKEQAEQIRKVNDELEVRKSARRVVAND